MQSLRNNDPDTDRIAGIIDTGMVPDQIELAASISKLLVTDGKTARLNIVDVVTGNIATAALDFAPGRITVDPNGLIAALATPRTGHLMLFDLLRRQTLGTMTGPALLQDMVFSADGRLLYLSGGNGSAIAVIDAETARGPIHRYRPAAGDAGLGPVCQRPTAFRAVERRRSRSDRSGPLGGARSHPRCCLFVRRIPIRHRDAPVHRQQ
jgi:hypothetical protein